MPPAPSSTGIDSADSPDNPSSPSPRRRQVLAALTAASVGTSALGASGGALASTGGPRGQADDEGPIREHAWVETPVDTNDSGQSDRVFVQVARPRSTEGDEALPVVGTATPYNGEVTHSDSTPEMFYDRGFDPQASTGVGDGDSAPAVAGGEVTPHHRHGLGGGPPMQQDSWLLSEGYVLANISSLGTHRSTGCYTAAGPETIRALAAVIDWFNGRATAYDAETGGEPVEAHWTNGRTGLIGTSADGELANGLATTGVDGLEAVVPNSANNGQFSLFRANGTPISVVPDESPGMADLGTWIQASNVRRPECDHWTDRVESRQDRDTGDYNDFWHEREFLTEASAVDCGVLLSHGVADETVPPNNAVDWFRELEAAGAPVRLWLHPGDHHPPHSGAWDALLERWWAYWLKDADNGVMDEDPVMVVHAGSERRSFERATYQTWPVPESDLSSLGFEGGGETAGSLTLDADGSETETAAFVDDPTTPATDHVSAAESTHRLRYESPPLGDSLHLSGRVVPDLRVSLDEPTVLSAALVAYRDRGSRLLTRGWVDPLNRPRYTEYDSPTAYKESLGTSEPLEAGEQIRVEFPLQATDVVVEAGSRLGLVVYGADRAFTLHPPGNAEVTLSVAESSVGLPVVVGRSAVENAFQSTPPEDSNGSETTDESPTMDESPATDASGAGGPGFGVGAGVAALATAGSLLARRVSGVARGDGEE